MIRHIALLLLFQTIHISQLAASSKIIHVWHCDKLDGALLPDAVGGLVRLQLVGKAKYSKGRFGLAVETGRGGYVKGRSIGVLPSGAIELWFKQLDTFPGKAFGLVGGRGEFPRNKKDSVLLGMVPDPGKNGPVRFGFGILRGGWRSVRINLPPEVGVWHHLVANWGTKGMQLFVDGKLVASNKKSRLGIPRHSSFFLGGGSLGKSSRALIDEIRIYSEPLSADVVLNHYSDASYVKTPVEPTEKTVTASVRKTSLNACDFMSKGSFTAGIQEAVDALPFEGGEVYIPPGKYQLRRSIELRDNVTLRGGGSSTILCRPPEVASKLTFQGNSGSIDVRVANTDVFSEGDAVNVYDDHSFAWLATNSIITRIDSRTKTITLEQGLRNTYYIAKNASINNFFPVVTAHDSQNITIRDLTVNGGADAENKGFSDFACSAIHLVNCFDCKILNCQVTNYPSDGISVQGGTRVVVRGNTVVNTRSRGMHPGTGLTHSIWSDNISRKNRVDGFYFCTSVRYSIVTNNIFTDNDGHGIGGLGCHGDKYNIVSNNLCARNGGCGIQVFSGSDNIVIGNICLNNSKSEGGRRAGIEVFRTTNTIISNNRCLDSQNTKTQLTGIDERVLSDCNTFVGNNCRGSDVGLNITGKKSIQLGNSP